MTDTLPKLKKLTTLSLIGNTFGPSREKEPLKKTILKLTNLNSLFLSHDFFDGLNSVDFTLNAFKTMTHLEYLSFEGIYDQKWKDIFIKTMKEKREDIKLTQSDQSISLKTKGRTLKVGIAFIKE